MMMSTMVKTDAVHTNIKNIDPVEGEGFMACFDRWQDRLGLTGAENYRHPEGVAIHFLSGEVEERNEVVNGNVWFGSSTWFVLTELGYLPEPPNTLSWEDLKSKWPRHTDDSGDSRNPIWAA
jgi:hypothetical protein